MKVTYYGHSCFGVRAGGKDILFDPFVTPNELAVDVDVKSIPADYILISHGHEDHLADAVAIANRTGAQVVSGFEIIQWFGKHGIHNGHALNHGGSWRFDFGRVKYVSAIHSSSFPDGSYAGNPGGFVVETSDGNFYYSGDTALTKDMELIGESTPLRFAVLCIGDNFTMGADDAIRACEMIRCNKVMGVHYDTFPPIRIDHKKTHEKFAISGKELHLLKIGTSANF